MSNENSGSGSTRPHFPKLAKTNYVGWSGDVLSHLMTLGLEDYINLETPLILPLKTADPEGLVKFLSNKKKVAGVLYGCIDQENHTRVMAKDAVSDPLKLWKTLKEHLQSSSDENQARAYLKFVDLTFSSDLETYISENHRVLAGMKAVDGLKHISQSYLGESIVPKLPVFMELTKTLLRKSHQPLTTKKVLNYLEDQLVNIKDQEDHVNAVALAAHRTSSRPFHTLSTSSSSIHRPYCSGGHHNEQVKGHTRTQCYQANPHLRPSNNNRPRASAATAPSAVNTASSDFFEAQAFVVTSSPHNLILLDSGCSHHMAPDLNLFINYEWAPATFLNGMVVCTNTKH